MRGGGDSSTQGGSSITQQLAKNLFLSSERTIERKIIEAFLAVWLEWRYSKNQILKLYFDNAYMGGGNFGVVAAADYYFGKQVQDISLAEAAMLSGLFKAPTRYAPHVDLAAARGRANLVLSNMVAASFLTEGQVTAARRHPATAIDRVADANSPNYFLDWAFAEAKKLIESHHHNTNNFVVRTTIDTTLQKYAEEAVSSTAPTATTSSRPPWWSPTPRAPYAPWSAALIMARASSTGPRPPRASPDPPTRSLSMPNHSNNWG
ncbi:MAG: penicillin-binding protein [Candidatus Devosia euplotis]|nr:penicillin-binding protein [Candidatus Devosia euplotis]